MLDTCSHGMREGCPDCFVDDLKELLDVLDEPDCKEVLEENIHKSLKCFGRKALNGLEWKLSAIPVPEAETYYVPPVRRHAMASQETAVPATAGSIYPSMDDEPMFHSPQQVRSPPSASRVHFHPSVVRASAFGAPAQAIVPAPVPDADTPTMQGMLAAFAAKPRANWSDEQISDLTRGYQRFNSAWETIRKTYPSLKQFTGTQLKDKWRWMTRNS